MVVDFFPCWNCLLTSTVFGNNDRTCDDRPWTFKSKTANKGWCMYFVGERLGDGCWRRRNTATRKKLQQTNSRQRKRKHHSPTLYSVYSVLSVVRGCQITTRAGGRARGALRTTLVRALLRAGSSVSRRRHGERECRFGGSFLVCFRLFALFVVMLVGSFDQSMSVRGNNWSLFQRSLILVMALWCGNFNRRFCVEFLRSDLELIPYPLHCWHALATTMNCWGSSPDSKLNNDVGRIVNGNP